MTVLLPPTDAGYARAAALLRAGGLVVYGLAGNAADDRAVASIYTAKARPSFNPLIVHVADRAALDPLVEVSCEAGALAAAFWPGPLTLVLPMKSGAPAAGPPRCARALAGIRRRPCGALRQPLGPDQSDDG